METLYQKLREAWSISSTNEQPRSTEQVNVYACVPPFGESSSYIKFSRHRINKWMEDWDVKY